MTMLQSELDVFIVAQESAAQGDCRQLAYNTMQASLNR